MENKNNNQVFVLTQTKPFQKEEFVDVFLSKQTAEKYLRKISPYLKKDNEESYHEGKDNDIILYFVRKTLVK